ncbi:MAG: SRPBCC family protein [Cyanobacteria bacterium SZAS TMP-1]|nr:SRPBCC family protein [Cyanobacteria bacterium SZAS TMP-1]
MPVIVLTTEIDAPIETCFDLARSIDFHMHSTSHTGERAVAGVVTGLIGAGDEVTWQARHFGLVLSLTSRITAFEPPSYFRDSMKSGPFKRFDHDHYFEFQNGVTTMRDRFDYDSPLGILGNIADTLFLERYMTELLVGRNAALKIAAETNPGGFLPQYEG